MAPNIYPIVDGEVAYAVNPIDRRTKYKKFEYMVEYKGYPLARDYEWRSELELTETAPSMLAEFTEMYDCVEWCGATE